MPATDFQPTAQVSPLLLSHQLLDLAQRADEAGMSHSARRLLALAHTVCNEQPASGARARQRRHARLI